MRPEQRERKRRQDRESYQRHRESKIARVLAYQATPAGRAMYARRRAKLRAQRIQQLEEEYQSALTSLSARLTSLGVTFDVSSVLTPTSKPPVSATGSTTTC